MPILVAVPLSNHGMASEKSIIYYGPGRPVPSAAVSGFARDRGLTLLQATSADEVSAMLNRSFPACLVLDASDGSTDVLDLCRVGLHDAAEVEDIGRAVAGVEHQAGGERAVQHRADLVR